MTPLLTIENLSINFVTQGEITQAVKNVSLQVAAGEILALVGESGSGKSVTALSVLQLLPIPPAQFASGQVIFNDENKTVDLLKLHHKLLQQIRGNRIAMIFQEPMTSLNPVITSGRQVMEVLLQHKKITTSQAKAKTIEWFGKVKLPSPEKMFDRFPHQLSGGQKQRVMIAMAMCCEPALLICDEPTTALDVTVQKTILQLIKDLQQEAGMGVLFISHDLGVVAEIADRVAIMYKGEIVEQNDVRSIFENPKHTYTKALIACRPASHPKGETLPIISDFFSTKEKLVPLQKNENQKQKFFPDILAEVKNVSVKFPMKTNLLGRVLSYATAVDNVSFNLYKGETLGLVGESGCGKTTLGRTLLRLIDPSDGKIIYNGTDITLLTKKELRTLRSNVQLVFQDPYSSLNPRLTIGAAIGEPLQVLNIEKNKNLRRKKVAELLEKVNLPNNYANRYPHEFSG
ncbi:MAG: ATP-binding cassette domain-containing protein, partial [Bacteroidota bacterium]|nr:ATP-binding cassette domain-containing protein [Bacteroidota bacterium]